MHPSRIFFCLVAVVILQKNGIVAHDHNHGQDLDNFIKVNTTVLDKFIQKRINEGCDDDIPFQSTIGKKFVKSIVENMFADQPSKFANTRTISY